MKCNVNGRYTYNKNKKNMKPSDYVKLVEVLEDWVMSSYWRKAKEERQGD